jgi:hypothetical protein
MVTHDEQMERHALEQREQAGEVLSAEEKERLAVIRSKEAEGLRQSQEEDMQAGFKP